MRNTLILIVVATLLSCITHISALSDETEVPQEIIKVVSGICKGDIECNIEECDKYYSDNLDKKDKCSKESLNFYEQSKEQTKDTPETPEQKEYTDSKWTVDRSSSKMDDSKSITLMLNAENSITDWVNQQTTPILIIRCRENKTELVVYTGMSANPEYGLYGESSVRVRLDDNKAQKQRWSESTSNKALFAPKPIELAKKINKSQKMLFEFVPYQQGSTLIEFDVRGLDPYLKELSETCNWKL